jgi:hypothetical protein
MLQIKDLRRESRRISYSQDFLFFWISGFEPRPHGKTKRPLKFSKEFRSNSVEFLVCRPTVHEELHIL